METAFKKIVIAILQKLTRFLRFRFRKQSHKRINLLKIIFHQIKKRLTRRPAAIDGKDRADHVAGRIAGEKYRSSLNFTQMPPAAQRSSA